MTNCRCDLNLEIQEAKPKTADEIRAEYERREFDLRIRHEYEMANLYRENSERLEALREQRAQELAEAIDPDVVDSLVKEGQRIGKVPWCCCAYTGERAAAILREHGITEAETMEETIERREAENDTHQQTTD